MGFGAWILLIIGVIVAWNLVQWGIRVNDEAKAEEERNASKKEMEDARNDLERFKGEVIRDLNKNWNDHCLEYIEALKSGDKFLATAKGRDFYACNRRYNGNRIQSQVIADEIRIKNKTLTKEKGPLLILANHPDSFLDAIILGAIYDRKINYLAV